LMELWGTYFNYAVLLLLLLLFFSTFTPTSSFSYSYFSSFSFFLSLQQDSDLGLFCRRGFLNPSGCKGFHSLDGGSDHHEASSVTRQHRYIWADNPSKIWINIPFASWSKIIVLLLPYLMLTFQDVNLSWCSIVPLHLFHSLHLIVCASSFTADASSHFPISISSCKPIANVSWICHIFVFWRSPVPHFIWLSCFRQLLKMSLPYWPSCFSSIDCISLCCHNLLNICNPNVLKYKYCGVSLQKSISRTYDLHSFSTPLMYEMNSPQLLCFGSS
jgi:hypothetical protein